MAVVDEHNGEQSCPFQDELDAYQDDPKHHAHVVGLEAVWDRIPFNGPRQLGANFYHLVDEENGIYEFIKGRLRVLCFEAGGAVCVCSSIFLKKSQKTPRSDVRKAIALKGRFLIEAGRGDVSYE